MTARTLGRMLPVWPSRRPRKDNRDVLRERYLATEQAMRWGVERRHACLHYDECLSELAALRGADGGRCPRICPDDSTAPNETREARMAIAVSRGGQWWLE